jgi:uncharacterized Zn finger protein
MRRPVPGSRRAFGTTWWGRAWIAALETRARLDPSRLARGKAYARGGAVRSLDLAPGAVTAVVKGSRPVPYDVVVSLRPFTADEWSRVLDVASSRIAHAAALLDGELPHALVSDVESAGLSLLPGADDLALRCSCPDPAVPCKHAAAVCYLVADLLDADPFELLLLRGRTRHEVLSSLRSRRSGTPAPPVAAAAPAEADDVDASSAFARVTGPLPDLPLPPARPGRPAPVAGTPPTGSVSPASLQALAADAAQRAWELLTGVGDGGLSLSVEEDVVRRAVSLLGTPALDRLAARANVPPRVLSRRARAWALGGRGALAVLDETWSPDAGDVAEAAAALGAGAHVWMNQVSDASDARQLRLGRDGLWYPLHRRGAWELAGPGAADPRVAASAFLS